MEKKNSFQESIHSCYTRSVFVVSMQQLETPKTTVCFPRTAYRALPAFNLRCQPKRVRDGIARKKWNLWSLICSRPYAARSDVSARQHNLFRKKNRSVCKSRERALRYGATARRVEVVPVMRVRSEIYNN